MSNQVAAEISAQTLKLLTQRAIGSSICTSEAPRSLYSAWREHMPITRLVAAQLAKQGLIVITQGLNISNKRIRTTHESINL
jgi:Protein of unknown function (DUF3253)